MLQETVQEQRRALYWHRKMQERMTPRHLLHESDQLMFWLEECIVQERRLVPGWLVPRLVALLAQADPELARELNGERRPGHVLEFLYRAQESLMERSIRSREPAQIIPLFREAPACSKSISTSTAASRTTARQT